MSLSLAFIERTGRLFVVDCDVSSGDLDLNVSNKADLDLDLDLDLCLDLCLDLDLDLDLELGDFGEYDLDLDLIGSFESFPLDQKLDDPELDLDLF